MEAAREASRLPNATNTEVSRTTRSPKESAAFGVSDSTALNLVTPGSLPDYVGALHHDTHRFAACPVPSDRCSVARGWWRSMGRIGRCAALGWLASCALAAACVREVQVTLQPAPRPNDDAGASASPRVPPVGVLSKVVTSLAHPASLATTASVERAEYRPKVPSSCLSIYPPRSSTLGSSTEAFCERTASGTADSRPG
jgi:hypothetical protein